MLALLPIFGNKMDEDGVDFLRSLKFLLFSFKELPNNWVFFGFNNLFSIFDYSQDDDYLNLINLDSGSSIVNCYSIIWISILIAILFGAAIIISSNPKHAQFGIQAVNSLSRVSIRLFMFSLVFILLTSASEANNYGRISKGFVSYILLGIWGVFLLLSIYSWILRLKGDENQRVAITSEFFQGIKNNSWSRLFIILWILKRIILISFIIFMNNLQNMLKLIFLTSGQLIYIFCIIQLSPFLTLKDNILEVLGEGSYLLLIPLTFYYKPSISVVDHTIIYWAINSLYTSIIIGNFKILKYLASFILNSLKKKSKGRQMVRPDMVIQIRKRAVIIFASVWLWI